ncbi:FecCD family ABC transporter permease [Janibacter cremeus]|uniref:Iron complex transport system permease protein n=1 Tax=Janibacter cremeus TaxID=1285192 RepID=A0A852VQA1_9MICO|nr:iron chelate uptake ABC transporter family permease subunit [Janibacter cremeus]NYF98376.1 iron complex transport system permease protein [Janibacter cremeus]
MRSQSLSAVMTLAAVLTLVAAMVHALTAGPVAIPAQDALATVARRMHIGDFDVTVLTDQIVWQLRLPRVLGAAAVGAALAISGAVLQSLTRNDLADPYLLGISGGGGVGAVAVIVLGFPVAGILGTAALAIGAFVGALGALALVLALSATREGDLPPARTVLAGVAVGLACSSAVSFMVTVLGDRNTANQVLHWTLGSVAGVRWSSAVFLVVVAVLATVVLIGFARTLDAFAFGENTARTLGIHVERVRWTLLGLTALVTACAVAYAGLIGFVGLVVPHVVRLLIGPAHGVLLPLSAILGATALVGADTLSRTLVESQEVPLGVVTGLVGAPVFALLLHRERRRLG